MSKSEKRESTRDTKPPRPPAPSTAAPAKPPMEHSPAEGSGVPLILRWFTSRTVRHAIGMRKHVQKLLNHQRDVLSPVAVQGIEGSISELQQALRLGLGKEAVEKQMENLETAANKWLKPYPNAAWRENVEVLLVALSVAMGIRTFFLQPFKIPTGSMQPTLFGVTSENLTENPDLKAPTGLAAVRDWFKGISYIHKVAEADGEVTAIDPPFGLPILYFWQTIVVGGRSYTIWLPPDYGGETLTQRSGLHIGQFFHKGEDILNLRVKAGDHLFVDRISYNFRRPDRGEIVVFETRGIQGLPQDQFYIKRLVGLGGEDLKLQQDYEVRGVPSMGTEPVGHLVVDGKPVTAATQHFENLYSFNGASGRTKVLQYQKDHYFGHALINYLQPGREFHVGTTNFFVMGDNTMNSLDSRYWGDFPQSQVIGKSFFVYWPISDRFGWGYH